MKRAILHEFHDIFAAYWDNDVFSWWTFSSYLNMWFCLNSILDDVVDLVYFLCSKRQKSLFDFDNLGCANTLFQSLSISFLRLFRDFGWFDIFEVFGDLVNLLLWFGRNRGWESSLYSPGSVCQWLYCSYWVQMVFLEWIFLRFSF